MDLKVERKSKFYQKKLFQYFVQIILPAKSLYVILPTNGQKSSLRTVYCDRRVIAQCAWCTIYLFKVGKFFRKANFSTVTNLHWLQLNG